MLLAALVVVVAVVVSFLVTKLILLKTGEISDAEKVQDLSLESNHS